MATAIILGTAITQKVFNRQNFGVDAFDLLFFGLIPAIVGARLYYVLVYIDRFILENTEGEFTGFNFSEAIDLRNGGIGIFGAISGGIIGVYLYYLFKVRNPKKLATIDNTSLDTKKIMQENAGLAEQIGGVLSFYQLAGSIIPGLVLGQSIGRWGNYFNQELYGKPTELPWGIFIEQKNRKEEYITQKYYHPVFFYESIANFIFFLFVYFNFNHLKRHIIEIYLIWYGSLRLAMETLRINETAEILGFRLETVISAGVILLGVMMLIFRIISNPKGNKR